MCTPETPPRQYPSKAWGESNRGLLRNSRRVGVNPHRQFPCTVCPGHLTITLLLLARCARAVRCFKQFLFEVTNLKGSYRTRLE